MPVLGTIRQEVFAGNVAAGKSYSKAAALAGYSKWSASCLGSQLMQQKRVRERVLELKATSLRPRITRESALEHLTDPESGPAITIRDERG